MQGHCLCGAVAVIAPDVVDMHACHCGMCRRWGGGPFLVVHCGTGLIIESEADVSRYDSSEWAQRGFCRHCGTHLFYQLNASGDYFVPVGLFGDAVELHFQSQIYIDSKPAYYSFADATEQLTEAEFLARFTSM